VETSDEQRRGSEAGTESDAGTEIGAPTRAELELELAQAKLACERAGDELEVFSQLTSGYWWVTELQGYHPDGRRKLARRAWATLAFTRTTGYESSDIRWLGAKPVIAPADMEAVRGVLDRMLRGASDSHIHEFRIIGRDGATMWVRQRLAGQGQGIGRRVFASGELITDRKRTEDALGHVEARFLSLVEHAPNVIVTIDLAGTILFVNRQMPGDGREPWELIGSTIFDLASEEGQLAIRQTISEVLTEKVAREFTLQGVRGAGIDGGRGIPERWYEVQAAPVIRGRAVTAITMILTDVTERRLAAEALRRLWHNVPDRITELDERGRITVTNRSIDGESAELLVGRSLFDYLSPDAGAALREAMDQARASGEPASYEISEPLGRGGDGSGEQTSGRSGQVAWWAQRVVSFGEGEARGFLLVGTDITDRRAAERERANLEAQLRQQQKLESIGTLASGVAHEINNPIQSIMNYADLVQIRAEPGSQISEFATEIVAETERVANIVRNLLAFARQEKEHHSPARVSDIIESTLALMRAVLRRDHIELRVDAPEDLPKIKCRSQQIQQVFMNLLGNARHALNGRYPEYDEDKLIVIVSRLRDRGGELWVETVVEDHGHGMAPNIVERIFDPFFTTKGRDEGTGLGLSVSHGIIREHRGELEVESDEGQGSRFSVNLRVDNGWGLELP